MKRLTLFLAACWSLHACQQQNHSLEKPVHKRLLGFKWVFVAEEPGDEYDKLHLARKLQQHRIEVIPVRDVLYVSLIRSVNACGQYQGNIAFSRDTIYLSYDLISDEVCASGRVDRLIYLIDNPDRKKYKVVSAE